MLISIHFIHANKQPTGTLTYIDHECDFTLEQRQNGSQQNCFITILSIFQTNEIWFNSLKVVNWIIVPSSLTNANCQSTNQLILTKFVTTNYAFLPLPKLLWLLSWSFFWRLMITIFIIFKPIFLIIFFEIFDYEALVFDLGICTWFVNLRKCCFDFNKMLFFLFLN